MKIIFSAILIVLGLIVTGCGTATNGSATAGCALAGFRTFYNYVPNPLSGGSGKTAALGPTILRMNNLDVTVANEGQFHETIGPHCLLTIRWTPTGSGNTYKYTLAANGTLTVINTNAALALSIAGGRSPF